MSRRNLRIAAVLVIVAVVWGGAGAAWPAGADCRAADRWADAAAFAGADAGAPGLHACA